MKLREFIKNNIYKYLNEEREIFLTVYHGTDRVSALDVKKHGVDMSKSGGGYFGWGFYTTPDFGLAKNNYADFSDDAGDGVVMEFKISKNANILDLRDSNDWETWKFFTNRVSDKNLYKTLVARGIDGLWDNSFGGVVVYNPKVLELINIHGNLNENTNTINKIKVYHSTNNEFETFSLDHTWDGFWFTDNIDAIKKNEVGAAGNKYIKVRYLTLNNPAGWDEYEKFSVGELLNMGYDSVILPENDRIDYLVFHSDSISKS